MKYSPTPFLDPRCQPKNGVMEFLGGPLDGLTHPVTLPAPRCEGGHYEYADVPVGQPWAYVWAPDMEQEAKS